MKALLLLEFGELQSRKKWIIPLKMESTRIYKYKGLQIYPCSAFLSIGDTADCFNRGTIIDGGKGRKLGRHKLAWPGFGPTAKPITYMNEKPRIMRGPVN